MTPVILLSDGYIVNGAEPWRFPTSKDLANIDVPFAKNGNSSKEAYFPYKRDDKLVRSWAIPGTSGGRASRWRS